MGDGKANILFVLPNFDTGGSEKLVFDIIKHIDKNKFAPVLCVFFSGKYEEEILKLGIPFYVIHKDSGELMPKLKVAKFISDIVKRHNIEVVNTHHNSPLIQGVIPFKILNRVRWFHTEHTRLDLDPNVNAKIKLLCRIAMMCVDQAVGISQGVCEDYHESLGVPKRKIVKVLNGVDIHKFLKAKSEEGRAKSREEFSIGKDDIVIGLFANFRKQKNHASLIRAFALLSKKIEEREENTEKSTRLVLAGNGPEFENSKQLCRELGLSFVDCSDGVDSSMISSPSSIFFLGMRHDIPELMNMIDIYCLPSHFEGLPFSLIEAFAAGKQVLATDVIGNRDVIQEMGCGTLVEPDNAQSLADALACAVSSLKSPVSENQKADGVLCHGTWDMGLGHLDSFPFSFHKMMNQYEELFSNAE